MAKYAIVYEARYEVVVEADSQGDALEKSEELKLKDMVLGSKEIYDSYEVDDDYEPYEEKE